MCEILSWALGITSDFYAACMAWAAYALLTANTLPAAWWLAMAGVAIMQTSLYMVSLWNLGRKK